MATLAESNKRLTQKVGDSFARGLRAAADKVSSVAAPAAAPAAPAATPAPAAAQPTYGTMDRLTKIGTTPPTPPQTPNLSIETPEQASARVAGTSAPSTAAKTGLRATADKALGYGGKALGVVGGGMAAAEAGRRMVNTGVDVDNATDLGAGLALAGGSLVSAPVATGAGAFLAGKQLGGYATEKLFGDAIANSVPKGGAQLSPQFQQEINAAGGIDKYLAARRPATGLTTPSAPTAAAVPAAAAPFQRVTDLTGADAARARAGIRNGTLNVGDDEGYIVNDSTGRVIKFNARPKEQSAAQAQGQTGLRAGGDSSDVRALLLAEVERARARHAEIGNKNTGGALQNALAMLSNYDLEKGKNDAAGLKARADADKGASDLSDKRMKEFREQHVENQFTTQKMDKDGNPTGEVAPDIEKNNRFLDFMRQADPRFATTDGLAEIWQLSAQDRNKLVSDMRKAFVEKENVEQITNENAWFTKPGLSNAPINAGAPREAVAGDIPNIGLGNYLYSNLPFTNRDVVDTSSGTLLAEDYIADDMENSAERRAKLYPKKGL